MSVAPSSSLKKRLAKLLPLLGSDKGGEVVNTARAIATALTSEGFDLHDLAASLAPSIAKQNVAQSIAPPSTFDKLSHFERRAWLDALVGVDWLTPFERERVVDVRNFVMTGVDCRIHWRKKRTVDELIARASAKGVRP